MLTVRVSAAMDTKFSRGTNVRCQLTQSLTGPPASGCNQSVADNGLHGLEHPLGCHFDVQVTSPWPPTQWTCDLAGLETSVICIRVCCHHRRGCRAQASVFLVHGATGPLCMGSHLYRWLAAVLTLSKIDL